VLRATKRGMMQIIPRFSLESSRLPFTNHSPGNAGLSDEAAGVSNDGAKSENADIAASAGNGKRRTPNAEGVQELSPGWRLCGTLGIDSKSA
jgi:hypothetical protein